MTAGGTYVSIKPWNISTRCLAAAAFGLEQLAYSTPYLAEAIGLCALALIPLVGLRFGAIAGFLTAVIGDSVLAAIHGADIRSFWNWTVANGLVGLSAGLIGFYGLRFARPSQRVVRVAVIAVVAVLLGLAFTATDILRGSTFVDWLNAEYLPAVLNYEIAVLLLVPVLDHAWQR
jgi:energy-coupling factor transport system substrate-specific component